jgi:hypothetical protein
MSPAQRKRVLATIFRELAMRGGKLESATPHDDWLPYFEHILANVPRVELRGFEPLTS